MATLILTSVGTALGGPLGGVLGGFVGQAIDQSLFGPPLRQGPRLGDLSVQTSSYGTAIPKIFGTMRIAGTVVWATDLKEEQSVQGAGKNGDYVAYTYSVSLAVALSSRPATSVGRIWADGKLLRGAAGDFKVGTVFRFYPGSEDQPVDPLIGSIETLARTPAYRGLALAVFEDLQLADYGNRIPVITFELVADAAPVEVATVLGDVTGGAVAAASGRLLGGFAAHGRSMADAIANLADLYDVRLRDSDGVLREAAGAVTALEAAELDCTLDGGNARKSMIERDREDVGQLPRSLSVTYYDASRDYQSGLARASNGGAGRQELQVELPASLAATVAKPLAQALLARRWIGRDRIRIALSPERIALAPGDIVQPAGIDGNWLVTRVTNDGLVATIEARRVAGGAGSAAADAGRATAGVDRPIAATRLALFELPGPPLGTGSGFEVMVAAASDGGFAPVAVDLAIGAFAVGAVAVRRKSVIGAARTVLAVGSSLVADQVSSVEVDLIDPAMVLLNADANALAMGANLALVGSELVQFARALLMAPARYRLSGLWRGRRGSEWAVPGHAVGEGFVLLDPAAQVAVPINAAYLGGSLAATPHGVADSATAPTRLTPAGLSRAPIMPAHVAADRAAGLTVRWQPRNAGWWPWTDQSGNEADPTTSFAVRVTAGAATVTATSTASPCVLSPTDVVALGAGPWTVAVSAVAAGGPSHPALIIV